MSPLETWTKSIETGFGSRLPGDVEFLSRLNFSEQTIAGRSDRVRSPQGRIQLAHRYFGLSARFEPTAARDSKGVTTHQQTLSLSGNAHKAGLPSLSGSWTRNRLSPTGPIPGSGNVIRSLSSGYNLGKLGFQASYGDRGIEEKTGEKAHLLERHLGLGSSLAFQIGRAPVAIRYDFGQSHANPGTPRSSVTRSHQVGVSSAVALWRETNASFAYAYRRTETRGLIRSLGEEHNGSLALALAHTLVPGVQFSTNGGVRGAYRSGHTATETFLAGAVAADAQARPGWRLGASVSRSYNWLPGERARLADEFQANTSMRLAKGLAARGDMAISSGRRARAASDTAAAPSQVGFRSGFGVSATPLRPFSVNLSVNRDQAGQALTNLGPATTSLSATGRLVPSSSLQLTGGWNRARGPSSRGTSRSASLQWTITQSLQATGTYGHSQTENLTPFASKSPPQRSASASLGVALSRKLNGSVRYSEANWGQPGHTRQWNADLARTFGR